MYIPKIVDGQTVYVIGTLPTEIGEEGQSLKSDSQGKMIWEDDITWVTALPSEMKKNKIYGVSKYESFGQDENDGFYVFNGFETILIFK